MSYKFIYSEQLLCFQEIFQYFSQYEDFNNNVCILQFLQSEILDIFQILDYKL